MTDEQHGASEEATDATTADPTTVGRRSSASAGADDTPGAADGTDAGQPRTRAERRRARGKSRWWVWPLVALLVVMLVRTFVVAPFSIPSGSMEHTLEVGDRILVKRFEDKTKLQRGDIIVFDGTNTFGALTQQDKSLPRKILDGVGSVVSLGSGTDYVKRIIGLPGDRVKCCTADGRLSVNGVPVNEPYLYPGDKASETPFDIQVPAGRLWVMGDHRSRSADSRAHLGSPGGGTIPQEDVIGTVWLRYWPLSRAGSVTPAPELAKIPRSTTTP